MPEPPDPSLSESPYEVVPRPDRAALAVGLAATLETGQAIRISCVRANRNRLRSILAGVAVRMRGVVLRTETTENALLAWLEHRPVVGSTILTDRPQDEKGGDHQ